MALSETNKNKFGRRNRKYAAALGIGIFKRKSYARLSYQD